MADYNSDRTGSNIDLTLDKVDALDAKVQPTATGVDVTGTITADGLTVDAATGIALKTGSSTEATWTHEVATGESTISVGRNSSWGADFNIETDTKRRLRINTGGDVSFYEDTGTTAKMVWDASAESLGIGKTPNYTLDIAGRAGFGVPNTTLPALGADTANFRIGNLTGGTINYGTMFGTLGTGDGYIQQQRFDGNAGAYNLLLQPNAGNVGIGTASPSGKLHADVSGTADALVLSRDGGANGKLEIDFDSAFTNFNSATGGYTFSQNTTERARIDSSGNLLVGTTSTTVGYGSADSGIALRGQSGSLFSRSNSFAISANRNGIDGDIVEFRKDGATVGSIGTQSGALTFANAARGFKMDGSSFEPIYSAGTEANGVNDIGVSANRWRDLYLSGGVYLGGTGAANKLDDYEEGTCAPVFADAISGGNVATAAVSDGTYTRVGRLVTVSMYALNLNTTGMTGSNDLIIRGLPFTAQTGAAGVQQGSVVVENMTFNGYLSSSTINGADYLVLLSSATGVQDLRLTVSAIENTGSDVLLTITYQTAA